MSERFYSAERITGEQAMLADSEAHHLLHVMRISAGDRVTLFDGSGAEFVAEVVAPRRSQVELAILSRTEIDCELDFPLIVGVALPKGDRQKWLVEKLTELGVSKLVPLITERSVAEPKPASRVRLEQAVIKASKQCGRNLLMEIAVAKSWEEFVRNSRDSAGPDTHCMIAHPGGEPMVDFQVRLHGVKVLAVGPEGGFAEHEVDVAVKQGWQVVSLGRRILRVETAALALVCAVAQPSTEC
jgi:16S rRNA (uracil1498-N3)-methyltransferase